MPRDGSGNYTLPAGNPVIPGTIIETTWANPTMTDIAAALTDSLSRTGAGGMLVPFLNADGTVSLPGISWANQQNMGFYRPGLDEMRVSVAGVDKSRWTSSATDPFEMFIASVFVPVMHEAGSYNPTGDWDWSGAASFAYFAPIFLPEVSVAEASVAGFGQFWVRDNVPNIPMFTDDAGTDFELNVSGLTGTVTDSTLRFNGSEFVEQTQVQISAAGVLSILDAGLTDGLAISHNGAGLMTFDFTNTTSLLWQGDVNLLLRDGSNLQIFDPANAQFISMLTDGITVTIGVSSGHSQVSISGGVKWQWLDATATHFGAFQHDGVDFNFTTLLTTDFNMTFDERLRLAAQSVAIQETAAAPGDEAAFGQFWVRDDVPNTPMFTDDAGTDFELNAGAAGPGRRGALAFRNSSQSITNNVLNAIQLNDTVYDTDSVFDIGDPTKLEVPVGVTKVRLGAGAIFVSSTAGQRKIEIRKNGSSLVFDASGLRPPMTVGGNAGVGGFFGQQVHSGSVDVVATDFFQAFVLQSSGGNLDLVANGSWMEMEILE